MRILIVCPRLGSAFGQERVLFHSTQLLRDAGHRVFHLGRSRDDQLLESDGIELLPDLFSHGVRSSPARLRASYLALLEVIEKVKPDIVHFYERLDSRIEFFLFGRVPCVFTEHFLTSTCPQGQRLVHPQPCLRHSGLSCLIYDRELECLQHLSLRDRLVRVGDFALKQRSGRRLAAIGAISRYVRKSLELSGFDPKKIFYVPNPIGRMERKRPREGRPYVLCASRFVEYKGLPILVDAVSKLGIDGWELRICGEGDMRSALMAQVEAKGLTSQIKFLGRTSFETTCELIEGAACVVQPNIGPEPFGLTVAEACSLKTPVIVADLPALNEIVVDGVTGWTFQPGNSKDLADKLSEVLSNPNEAERRAHAACERMQVEYSPGHHLQATLEMYRQAAANYESK